MPQSAPGQGLAEDRAAQNFQGGGNFQGGQGGNFRAAAGPMEPVPGIKQEGNVYRPIQVRETLLLFLKIRNK